MIRRGWTQRNLGAMPPHRPSAPPDPSVDDLLELLYSRGFVGAFAVAEHFHVDVSRARVLLLSAQARRLTCAVDAGEYHLTGRGNEAARLARVTSEAGPRGAAR